MCRLPAARSEQLLVRNRLSAATVRNSLTLRVLWGVCGTFVFVTCFQFSALGEIRSEMTPTSVVDRVIALFRWWTTPVWEGCGYGELPCLRGTFGLQVEAVALGQLPLLFFFSFGPRLDVNRCKVDT